MSSTAFSAVTAQLSSRPQLPVPAQSLPAQSLPVLSSHRYAEPVPPFFQSMNIRYELCSHTGSLKTLYRDGYSVSGYTTIEQFYADMATAGWQVDSTQQVRSCSLHFSVLKRAL